MTTCAEIMKRHGGHITIYSEPGQGTTINVYLPYSSCEVPDDQPIPNNHILAPRGTETVLVVEDDPAVRTLQARVLRDHGYTVLGAGDGVEALALVAAYGPARIDLLLTDIVMPQMGGIALTEAMRMMYPMIKTIFTSGYAGQALIQRDTTVKDIPFLAKPQLASMLLQRVREVLDDTAQH
jgi:two-component system, cell cycle sensor histidine kinase and response regulator CckA